MLLREADGCSGPHDLSTDCCEFGRTRGARYQIAAVLGCKRLPKWHTHMVYVADPRTKRRRPGFRRDRDGLSHSVDPHTTTYNVTLPLRSTLVARQCTLSFHARRLRLRTRQSAESWSEAELKPSLRNNPWGGAYQGLRGGSKDDGRARAAGEIEITCYVCNAVECGRVAVYRVAHRQQ